MLFRVMLGLSLLIVVIVLAALIFNQVQPGGGVAMTTNRSSLPVLRQAPELVGLQAWFNTDQQQPLTLSQLRGKVVIVKFWTFG